MYIHTYLVAAIPLSHIIVTTSVSIHRSTVVVRLRRLSPAPTLTARGRPHPLHPSSAATTRGSAVLILKIITNDIKMGDIKDLQVQMVWMYITQKCKYQKLKATRHTHTQLEYYAQALVVDKFSESLVHKPIYNNNRT